MKPVTDDSKGLKVLYLQHLQTALAKSFKINEHSNYYANKLSLLFATVAGFGSRKSFR